MYRTCTVHSTYMYTLYQHNIIPLDPLLQNTCTVSIPSICRYQCGRNAQHREHASRRCRSHVTPSLHGRTENTARHRLNFSMAFTRLHTSVTNIIALSLLQPVRKIYIQLQSPLPLAKEHPLRTTQPSTSTCRPQLPHPSAARHHVQFQFHCSHPVSVNPPTPRLSPYPHTTPLCFRFALCRFHVSPFCSASMLCFVARVTAGSLNSA